MDGASPSFGPKGLPRGASSSRRSPQNPVLPPPFQCTSSTHKIYFSLVKKISSFEPTQSSVSCRFHVLDTLKEFAIVMRCKLCVDAMNYNVSCVCAFLPRFFPKFQFNCN